MQGQRPMTAATGFSAPHGAMQRKFVPRISIRSGGSFPGFPPNGRGSLPGVCRDIFRLIFPSGTNV
jgi:hypothetical protein